MAVLYQGPAWAAMLQPQVKPAPAVAAQVEPDEENHCRESADEE